MNIFLGMQRSLDISDDEAFDYLCSARTDSRKKENKAEIHLIKEDQSQEQPAPAKPEIKPASKQPEPPSEKIEPDPEPAPRKLAPSSERIEPDPEN